MELISCSRTDFDAHGERRGAATEEPLPRSRYREAATGSEASFY